MRRAALVATALFLTSCDSQVDMAARDERRPEQLDVQLKAVTRRGYTIPYLVIKNRTKDFVCVPYEAMLPEYQNLTLSKGDDFVWQAIVAEQLEFDGSLSFAYFIIPPGQDLEHELATSLYDPIKIPKGPLDYQFIAEGFDCRGIFTSKSPRGAVMAEKYLLYGTGTIDFGRLSPGSYWEPTPPE